MAHSRPTASQETDCRGSSSQSLYETRRADPKDQEEVGDDRLPAGPLGWVGEPPKRAWPLRHMGWQLAASLPHWEPQQRSLYFSLSICSWPGWAIAPSLFSAGRPAGWADTKASVSLLCQPGPRRPCHREGEAQESWEGVQYVVRLPSRCNGEGPEDGKDSRFQVPASVAW